MARDQKTKRQRKRAERRKELRMDRLEERCSMKQREGRRITVRERLRKMKEKGKN